MSRVIVKRSPDPSVLSKEAIAVDGGSNIRTPWIQAI